MKFGVFVVLVLSLLSLPLAKAAGTNEFSEIAYELDEKCDFLSGRCQAPYFGITIEGNELKNHPQYAAFQTKADRLSFIWNDTVYEGDCRSNGPTELTRVVQIMRGDQTVAYFLEYGEAALTRYRHQPAYVSEGRMVSPDLKHDEESSNHLADCTIN